MPPKAKSDKTSVPGAGTCAMVKVALVTCIGVSTPPLVP